MSPEFRAGETTNDRVGRCPLCRSNEKVIRPAAGGCMIVCSSPRCEFYGENCPAES